MEQKIKNHPCSIDGIIIQPLKVIEDERGSVLHMLRADSPLFKKFGEIYFSEVKPGVIKAWKRHLKMTQYFTVPVGRMKFVFYDDRSFSSTKGCLSECVLGRPEAYHLLIIPPMVWYGFQCLSDLPSMIANCSDLPHDPKEQEHITIESGKIPYQW